MIRAGVRRLLRLPLRGRWERDVEDEIKLHLAMRAEQLMAEGRTPDEAYDEAVRRFAGTSLNDSRAQLVEAARHREQRMHRTEYFHDLRQDVAFALRTLRRQKAWTTVTVLTFALGIGATTAVFSVVSTLLIHALPYPHADRVVVVNQQPRTGNHTGISVTIAPATPVIRAWSQQSRSFESLQPARINPRSLKTKSGEPSLVNTAAVLPSFPAFAGTAPIRGRMFTDADIASGNPVAVLGEGFWRDRLGADPAAVGMTLTLGDSVYTIIGVLPASLRYGSPGRRPTDVWTPFNLADKKTGGALMGRLRPGVTLEAAQRELDTIYARSSGFTGSDIPFVTVVQTPSQRVSIRDSLILLSVAVGLLLLVACTNVAHLLLARAATRQRELAIRTALGAGRARMFRQLLTESALLTAIGTAVGILVGWLALRGLIALRPASHDELKAATLDAFTVLVAAGAAVVSGLAFGLLGAVQSSRGSTHETLKSGASGASIARGQRRARSLLVVTEVALSVMLVVGAGLVVRSLRNLQRTDVGFDPRGLYTLYLSYGPGAGDSTTRAQARHEVELRAAAIPAVRSLAVAEVGPGSRSFAVGRLEIEGETTPSSSATSFIDVNHVQPSYFATMGIRMMEGSAFPDTNAQAVIVNESFARKHWARGAALGHRLRVGQTGEEPWLTIVGVAHDALTSGPLSESTAPMLYVPPARHADSDIMVRFDGDPRLLASLREVAKASGIRDLTVESVESIVSRSISEPRFVVIVLGAFSGIALLLASIGLYGVMAHTVAQETRETGIRVALGASRAHVIRRVLVRGVSLATAGVAFGLIASAWGTKLVEKYLFGVQRLDAAAFATAAGVLILAAVLACFVPTRRALAVDPMTAIRAD